MAKNSQLAATRTADSSPTQAPARSEVPERAGLLLTTLILVAAVVNLPLAVANVALPNRLALQRLADPTQPGRGLLFTRAGGLGAVVRRGWRPIRAQAVDADRHVGGGSGVHGGRLVADDPGSDRGQVRGRPGRGHGLSDHPVAHYRAAAPGRGTDQVDRVWSAVGASISVLGALVAGLLLSVAWWGSVFLCPLPLAVVAFPLAWKLIPSHVNETTDPVDHLGGMLSLLLMGGLILSINFATVPNSGTIVLSTAIIAAAALGAFVIRQHHTTNPLFDLHIAGRPTFWVAACSGIIVFGSLMGAIFIGEQYFQNVLGYSTIDAGLAILPAAVLMVLIAPHSAKLVDSHGSRLVLAGRRRVHLPRLSRHAAALERGRLLLGGGPWFRFARCRGRVCWHAGL